MDLGIWERRGIICLNLGNKFGEWGRNIGIKFRV